MSLSHYAQLDMNQNELYQTPCRDLKWGLRGVYLSAVFVLKLRNAIKLGQPLQLELLRLAMCVENGGPQRERRM